MIPRDLIKWPISRPNRIEASLMDLKVDVMLVDRCLWIKQKALLYSSICQGIGYDEAPLLSLNLMLGHSGQVLRFCCVFEPKKVVIRTWEGGKEWGLRRRRRHH